ncbi:MAG: tRNA (N(6)-L-threonylcarbamoyladenosine(37)-C(2))-methylthiotransferase MtaB [Candidatus Magnetominusculus sp. LBB02]|nr:tRNA (N(6)-L-threonylcarbamoyladenosine(37)-C(2))-methylthiotransferase MtaB [Candidatus Magnetominusculus sp. LBB02]
MKFCVLTLGCKSNQSESSLIEDILLENAHRKTSLDDTPDLCVINSCSVTAKSDYQSRQLIRRALKAGASVIVTGCYSELNEAQVRQISNDVTVVKNDDKGTYFKDKYGPSKATSTHRGGSRALLKIQDGCNASCTYCIIPQTRGASRSRPSDEIVREAKALEAAGFMEIVITGIHIGYYGVDLSPKIELSELIENILINTNNLRVRLTSIEVSEITANLLRLFESDRVCSHIHIPLQSGNDDILRKMRRPYSTADFRQTVLMFADAIDNVSIGSDVIVGFPGETDHEFNDTYEFIASLPLAYLHVFPYSIRKNTKAADMDGHVEQGIKKNRAARLRELSGEKKQAYMALQTGKVLTAAVETIEDALFTGTTGNYLKIVSDIAAGFDIREKCLIKLLVTGYGKDCLAGKPIIIR